ncbi:putative signal peptide protein [Pseudomonas chlororaphis subsp. aureofaciens]|nr:putative signal peptide protein [Pseudomonas chlororaphis subsp. aureofaciens]
MSDKPVIVLVHGFWGGAAHWNKIIVELLQRGYTRIRAVELPLTSLADDVERTRKLVAQQQGPVLLVGHSYGGAVITEAGLAPNVAGLVYIAAFAPDAGESPGSITQQHPPVAAANLQPDSDGYLWVQPELFHESFCQDLPEQDGLVMGLTQKAPLASTFGDPIGTRLEAQAVLVPDFHRGPDDRPAKPAAHGRAPGGEKNHQPGRQSRLPRLPGQRGRRADRRSGQRAGQGLTPSLAQENDRLARPGRVGSGLPKIAFSRLS